MKEKAAKKQSFLNRKRAEWKEMKLWNGNELCKVDWIVSILILTVLFFTCVHSDVKMTSVCTACEASSRKASSETIS